MTTLLEKVTAEVSKRPEEEQNRWANLWLDELAEEYRWDQAFAASQPALGELAEEALGEHRAGRTEVLDPDGS